MRLEDILSLWLVEVPEYTSSFIRITIIGSFLTCLQTPLTVGLRSQGNIGKPFFWSGIAELFVVPICYLFLLFEYSPTTVFIVQVVVELLVLVIRVYYCNILIGLSISKYVWNALVYPFSVVIVISGVSFLTLSNISVSDTGFWYLLTVSLFCIILSLIMICMLGLRKSERKKISEFVIKRLHIY
jgi:Na+-driven multidrug efflux pump